MNGLWIALAIIIVAFFYVRHERNNIIKNFQILAQKVNGTIQLDSKLSSAIFTPDIVFNAKYADLDFTIMVHDGGVKRQTSRLFILEAKSTHNLLPFSIVKETGPFVLSVDDVPMSEYSGQGCSVFTKSKSGNGNGKEIVVGGKKYRLYSDKTDNVSEILKSPDSASHLQSLLSVFKSIEVEDNRLKMAKRWTKKDSDPNRLIKLFDNVAGLAKSI